MNATVPIVRPVCNKRTPKLGPSALMVSSESDLQTLCARLNLSDSYKLYMSRLFYNAKDSQSPALVGPVMGSPYAVMLLEIIHAWGVRNVIFFGWCGSIQETLHTGDIIVPSGALIEEGTSPQYQRPTGTVVNPDEQLSDALESCFAAKQIAFNTGLVWTTDGVFRETPEKVQHFRQQGALAVEMELSALFSVGAFHGIALAGALAVSDELFSMCWQPGFKSAAFIHTRDQISGALADFITKV